LNSKCHLTISIVKSAVRITSAILAIILNEWCLLAIGLIIAEVGGVFEELFDDR
jgi:hypothetical protein